MKQNQLTLCLVALFIVALRPLAAAQSPALEDFTKAISGWNKNSSAYEMGSTVSGRWLRGRCVETDLPETKRFSKTGALLFIEAQPVDPVLGGAYKAKLIKVDVDVVLTMDPTTAKEGKSFDAIRPRPDHSLAHDETTAHATAGTHGGNIIYTTRTRDYLELRGGADDKITVWVRYFTEARYFESTYPYRFELDKGPLFSNESYCYFWN